MVEIEAEGTLFGTLFERLMRGCDDADVDIGDGVVADALNLATLEEAKHFGLEGEGHLADLIEEEGSAVGCFDATDSGLGGTGERAAGVTEEFGFKQRFGDGGAVEDGHDLVRAGAEGVDSGGDELFAGAGRTFDQDGGVARGDQTDDAAEFEHGGAFPDHAGKAVTGRRSRRDDRQSSAGGRCGHAG